MKWCVLVLVFAGLTRGDNVMGTINCPDLNSQDEIDLDKIMGKWYVVEVLEHKPDPTKVSMSKSYVVDSCPIVNLRSTSDSATMKLYWSEETGNLEYTFRITDFNRKGYWRVINNQNGTLAEKQYKQFYGSVHVMKAVASDMVLTFCSRHPDHQLYSLLLSREHILQKSDKRGVHKLLDRRGLKILSIRETCVNGSAGSRRAAFDLTIWTTLVGLLSSSFLFRSWQ